MPPCREQPGGVDLSGDMTDFFNVSYDILCRTGTQVQDNWAWNGSPSGAAYDRFTEIDVAGPATEVNGDSVPNRRRRCNHPASPI
jgi:hypothetical protein